MLKRFKAVPGKGIVASRSLPSRHHKYKSTVMGSEGGKIIRTKEDMDKFIFDNDLIDNAAEWANDSDYMFRHNNPSSFGTLMVDELERHLEEWIEDYGYSVSKGTDPKQLISNKVIDEIYDYADSINYEDPDDFI